jgi:hypothetical protein
MYMGSHEEIITELKKLNVETKEQAELALSQIARGLLVDVGTVISKGGSPCIASASGCIKKVLKAFE